jgi:hypothetical protein
MLTYEEKLERIGLDHLGWGWSSLKHLASDVTHVVKKTLGTAADVAAKAAKSGGNVLVHIEDKAGNITKRVIPGKWANKYIDFTTNTVKKGTAGSTHFINNVLRHPNEVKSVIIHPFQSTNTILTATDKWVNR